MPVDSSYPKLDIPDVDLWEFLFEREKREFPDDKSVLAIFTLVCMDEKTNCDQ